ncbi:unnamed protein product [Pseudo-nitzschia multistriata]|uniref:Uncharacterized protein n=1 Tax=Pseudo-nitzschia multistriata TaxID=183589 RepID=A0A448ZHC6_9STRA|nr:unnamed protein product [Pseudo-nitzschia multistriata]
MDKATPKIFNRKAPPDELFHSTGSYTHNYNAPIPNRRNPLEEQLAKHFRNNSRAATNEGIDNEIKQVEDSLDRFRGFTESSKKISIASSTSAFTKPDPAVSRSIGDTNISHQYHHHKYDDQRSSILSNLNTAAIHAKNTLREEASTVIAPDKFPYYRSASPIARMRDNKFQAELSPTVNIKNNKIDSPSGDITRDYSSGIQKVKSEHEVRMEKRRKWKKKMKIAQARKRRERRARDDYTIGSSSHFGRNSAIIGCVLDNVEGTEFFQRLTQCTGGEYHRGDGCAASEYEESEYGSMSSATGSYSEDYYSDEDMFSFGTDASDIRKGDGKGNLGSQKVSINSPSRESYDLSVDTTVPEEMTASFLSGDEISTTERSTTTDYARYGRPPSSERMATNLYQESFSDSRFIEKFITGIERKGESLLWHQETSGVDPKNVIVRLKRGFRTTRGTYCAPRLIWTDHQNGLNYGFDVFDIQSLERADIMHLRNFPYAMPGRSMLLQLKNATSFIFEAGTEGDAERFVRGVRLVVTHLAYNLVVANLGVGSDLLNICHVETESTSSDRLESDWFRAMDDVTEQLIDNAIASNTQ